MGRNRKLGPPACLREASDNGLLHTSFVGEYNAPAQNVLAGDALLVPIQLASHVCVHMLDMPTNAPT